MNRWRGGEFCSRRRKKFYRCEKFCGGNGNCSKMFDDKATRIHYDVEFYISDILGYAFEYRVNISNLVIVR